MKKVEDLTHDEIAEVGARKLKQMGYIAVFANINSAAAGERPDALGVKSCGETFLLESKVSRADFFNDLKKPWRKDSKGIGDFRAYITPKGLLKPEEIPYGWMLWEVHGKTKPVIKVIKGEVRKRDPSGLTNYTSLQFVNCDRDEVVFFLRRSLDRATIGLLATILNRAESDGVNIQKYSNMGGKGFLK